MKPTNTLKRTGSQSNYKAAKKARDLERKQERIDKEGFITPKKFVKLVKKFETKHRRLTNIDDLTNLYEALQVDDLEPHDFFVHKASVYIVDPYWTLNSARKAFRKFSYSLGWYYDECYHKITNNFWMNVDWENMLDKCKEYDSIGYSYTRTWSPALNTIFEESTLDYCEDYLAPQDDEDELTWLFEDAKSKESDLDHEEDDGNFISDIMSQVNNILKNIKDCKTPGSDIYFSILEDLVSIFILVQQKSTWISISVLCANIIKRYLGSSLIGTGLDIYNYIMAPVEEPPEPHGWEENLNKIKNAPAFFKTKIFKQLRKLLVGMISCGLVNPINLTVKGIELLDIQAEKIATSALDFLDYILDLVTYFIKIGHMVFLGDFSFLETMDDLDELDNNIIHLKSNIDRVANGGYFKDTRKTVGEYKQLLFSTHEQVRVMTRRCTDNTLKKTLMSKLDEVTRLVIKFEQINPMAGMRKAPFAISIYGLSSVGKSSVAEILMKSILKSNGFSCEDSQLCTLQPNDSYYSTYRQDTVGVFLDDVSNTIASKAEANPADQIISLCNNVKYSAPKADTKDKGIFNVEPHVVIATTNCKDLGAAQWSVEPFSVVRRMRYHITVEVKPEYADMGKLISSRIDEKNTMMWKQHGVMDVWNFTVEQAIALPRTESTGPERYNFVVVKNKLGVPMTGLNIFELQAFLNSESAKFYADQEALVNGACNSAAKMEFCQICKYQKFVCTCNSDDASTLSDEFENIIKDQLDIVKPKDPLDFVIKESGAGYNLLNRILRNKAYLSYINKDKKSQMCDDQSASNQSFVSAKSNISSDASSSTTNYMENHDSITTKAIGYVSARIIQDQLSMLDKWLPVVSPSYLDSLTLEDSIDIIHNKVKHWRDVVAMDAYELYDLAIEDPIYDIKEQCLYSWMLFKCLVFGAILFSPLLLSRYALLYIFFIGVLYYKILRSNLILLAKTIREFQAQPMTQMIRDRAISISNKHFIIGGISLATLGALICTIKLFKTCREPHGNLCPVSEDDYKERDKEVNPWKSKIIKHETNPLTKTMNADDLLRKVSRNCFHFVMETESTIKKVACIAISPTVMMFPYHFFHVGSNITKEKINKSMFKNVIYDDLIKGTVIRKGGGTFVATITPSDIVRIGNSDLCLALVSNTGDLHDIVPYITESWSFSGLGVMGYRNAVGEWISCTADCTKSEFEYSPDKGVHKITIRGGKSKLGIPSQRGMCTAPIVCESTGPSIIGFHIAGHTNTTSGAYNTITRSEVVEARTKLFERTGTLEAHSAADFKTIRYNVDVNYTPTLSSKAPVNWLEDGAFLVRGDIDKQYSYWTNIRRTIMCPIFEELTGTECMYAGPQFGPETHKPFSTHLQVAAEPGHCFNSQLLHKAKKDYLGTMEQVTDNYIKYNKDYCKPLNEQQIINGIPGVRFIDSMNMGASFGFPKGKKKRHYLRGEPGNMWFYNQDEIDAEVSDMSDRYLRGVRYYPIFRACLKDEPQRKDKFKVRVFHACDMALQFSLRKYFLPIARIFHMHPIESECAVGINPHSHEWHQMHDYITFSDNCADRIVAGDYGKWDIRLPPDVVFMAFQILIEIAMLLPGYTEDDIKIMRGLATDVTYFTCHFNGTLIEFTSGVPSGHNLTALLNSICNSLLQRCGYFHSGGVGKFRDYVHTSTYGDDFWSGVSFACNSYNHITYRDFLQQYDIVLTMPNKSDEAIPYMCVWWCDFLKRRSSYDMYTHTICGALDVTSINKSLLVKGKTTTSNKRHAYDVLYSAMRELSYHDIDTYNYWSGIYNRIAEELKILFPGKGLSYEEYYKFRMEEGKPISDGVSSLTGYPMTQEAFSETIILNLEDKSTLDEDDSYELELLFNPTELANTLEMNSYHDTIIREGSDCLMRHMEPHAEVYGNEPSHQDAATLQSGVLHMSGAKEEAVISTELVNKDLLSLRQHESRALSHYLERPMQIAQYGIPVGGEYFFNPRPLRIFLGSKLIRDKIRHYAYLNGVLNVKVTSVGSPQITGAAHIALHPWWARDNGLGSMGLAPATELTHCQMSQLPSFVVDFGAETGGHIRMPIVAPTNGLNISEIDQIEDAFMLHVRSFVPLQIPTNSTITASLQIYVWLEDVSLTGTTYRSELPAPQSDEFSKDPNEVGSSTSVSFKQGLAQAAGDVVGKATEIGVSSLMSAMGLSSPLVPSGVEPLVPRTSTNMACYNSQQNIDSLAGDVKNEVSLGTKELGYSDIDHMALSNIYRRWGHIGRLSLDLTGLIGQDSDIKIIPVTPLAASFFTAGSDVAYSPTPLAIATLPFAKWRGGLEYRFHAIGSAFLKGKIRISHDVNTRIQIGNEVRDFKDTQTLNSVIWDISQYRTMTVQVPWTSNLAFKDTGLLRPPFSTSGSYGTSETTFDSTHNGLLILEPITKCSDQSYTEAYVLVSVRAMEGLALGDLRAPLTNYTYSGINYGQIPTVPEPQDDEVVKPPIGIGKNEAGEYYFIFQTAENVKWFNQYMKDHYMEPQSDIIYKKADVTTFGGQVSQTAMCVNITGLENCIEDHDNMALACMGEKYFNIRQIIKRYTHNWTRLVSVGNNGGITMHRFKIPDRPIHKGWQGPLASLNTDPGGKPCTYARDSFLSFFSLCFLGYRGSFRHKVLVTTNDGTNRNNTVTISRGSAGVFYEKVNYANTNFNQSSSAIQIAPDMRAGGTITVNHQAPMTEYSTPFHCRAKFAWAQDRTPQNPKFTYDGGFDIPWHQITVITPEAPTKWFRIDKFIAAGDDFSLYFYLYAPIMLDKSPTGYAQ